MATQMPAGCQCALHPSAGPRPPLPNSPPSTPAQPDAAALNRPRALIHLPWPMESPLTCSETAIAISSTRNWPPPLPPPRPTTLSAQPPSLLVRKHLGLLKRFHWHPQANINPRNAGHLPGVRFTCECPDERVTSHNSIQR